MLSQLIFFHCSHVADALPVLSPFQQSFQQLQPPVLEHPGALNRSVTPLQTAVRSPLKLDIKFLQHNRIRAVFVSYL